MPSLTVAFGNGLPNEVPGPWKLGIQGLSFFGGYMELSDQIKQIAEFWLGFEFLKKFKETGIKYTEEINKEKKNEKLGIYQKSC